MVPLRPNGGSPKGKTVWRELKVGLVVWLRKHETKYGKHSLRPIQREVTAFLGDIEQFKPRLWLAALNQGILKAKRVVWLSDGGKGYWGVYHQYIAPYADGILDFYHAVQNLWRGVKVWLDGRTKKALRWFQSRRRKMRDGKADEVLREIKKVMDSDEVEEFEKNELKRVYTYLNEHAEHMKYDKFKELGYPIGSGMVESACKWSIQQRFKGVGMRWSEEGLNHLLYLRLRWINNNYFDLWEKEEEE